MEKDKTLKAVKIAVGSTVAASAAFFAFSNLLYDQMFTAKAMAKSNDSFVLEPAERERYLKNPSLIRDDKTWYACMEHEDAAIVSGRGDNLYADVLHPETPSHVWCLCLHGWTSYPQNVAVPARHFYEKGYHVLLPHMRAHGKSEHKNVGMGWFDRLDMLDWIDHILTVDPQARIFMIGVSMGAATVMMTGGEALPSAVKCLIADCGYTSVRDEIAYEIRHRLHMPVHPLLDYAQLVCRLRAGYDMKKASSVEQLKKCRTPILFIHGELDDFVPYAMMQKVYDAAAGEKEMLSMPDAAHAVSWDVHPEIYWPKADAFVEKYVKTDPIDG